MFLQQKKWKHGNVLVGCFFPGQVLSWCFMWVSSGVPQGASTSMKQPNLKVEPFCLTPRHFFKLRDHHGIFLCDPKLGMCGYFVSNKITNSRNSIILYPDSDWLVWLSIPTFQPITLFLGTCLYLSHRTSSSCCPKAEIHIRTLHLSWTFLSNLELNAAFAAWYSSSCLLSDSH